MSFRRFTRLLKTRTTDQWRGVVADETSTLYYSTSTLFDFFFFFNFINVFTRIPRAEFDENRRYCRYQKYCLKRSKMSLRSCSASRIIAINVWCARRVGRGKNKQTKNVTDRTSIWQLFTYCVSVRWHRTPVRLEMSTGIGIDTIHIYTRARLVRRRSSNVTHTDRLKIIRAQSARIHPVRNNQIDWLSLFRFTFQEVGSIIGKKGEIVKRFREEVRIRVHAHSRVEQGRDSRVGEQKEHTGLNWRPPIFIWICKLTGRLQIYVPFWSMR